MEGILKEPNELLATLITIRVLRFPIRASRIGIFYRSLFRDSFMKNEKRKKTYLSGAYPSASRIVTPFLNT